MPTETKTDKTAAAVCTWCGKTMEEHDDPRPKDAPVPRVPCLLLKSGFKAKGETAEKPAEYTPRKLKAILGGSRAKRLVDADTGEDLRLPIISMTEELFGQQANVHCTFVVVGVEREK